MSALLFVSCSWPLAPDIQKTKERLYFVAAFIFFPFPKSCEPQDIRHFGESGVSWRTLRINIASKSRKSGPISTLTATPKLLLVSSKST